MMLTMIPVDIIIGNNEIKKFIKRLLKWYLLIQFIIYTIFIFV